MGEDSKVVTILWSRNHILPESYLAHQLNTKVVMSKNGFV